MKLASAGNLQYSRVQNVKQKGDLKDDNDGLMKRKKRKVITHCTVKNEWSKKSEIVSG
jgi:hypothetical protein